ncbi:MAG: polysaccharide biosynthesis tyrosine autokinase [Coriobacteriia bacterium]|nr:polysaccharide biosynthesis tyrosine autokinase [Coriobacteriia bacterium]
MELRDYLKVVRARKWVILQAVVVVTLTALVVSFLQPPRYQGEAKVLISEKDTGAALFGTILPELSSQPERGLQTQVQLMQLRPLAEETIRKLDLKTDPETLLKRVQVSAVGQTNIVTIKATDGDPESAARIANTMADEFVQWSKGYKRESLRAASTEVESRLEEAKEQVLELGRKIDAEGKSDDVAAELQIATGAYTTLAEKLEQLRINEQLEIGSGRVVSGAVGTEDPVSPKPLRNGVLGTAVGLVFGLGMAFLYEYLDNTIKSEDEVERLFGAPVLGHIPTDRVPKEQAQRLAIVESPGSRTAEAYRVLRNSLDFINFQHDTTTLLVTSAAPGEGKSTVAANLAASLAQAGQKVVMMSCDFRRPTTERFFGVTNMIGLSDVLTGSHSLKAAMQRPGDEQLVVLTSGKMPPNPSELLSSKKMQELVDELEEWADWVIIDTPPLLAVADPAAVARWADGVLLVTRAGVSTREAGRNAKEMLDNVGARVIGVAVWDLGEAGSASGYDYGSHHYGNYYYADYYSAQLAGQSRSAKHRDSGAKAPVRVTTEALPKGPPPRADILYIPPRSPGRKLAEGVGRMLAAMLGFLAVVAVAGAVAYVLDAYFGWGLVAAIARL